MSEMEQIGSKQATKQPIIDQFVGKQSVKKSQLYEISTEFQSVMVNKSQLGLGVSETFKG